MTTRADTMLEAITTELEMGGTVYICSAARHIKITPQNYRKWKEKGAAMFRIQNGHLCVATGRRWDSIMGCEIKVDTKSARI